VNLLIVHRVPSRRPADWGHISHNLRTVSV
jgi:hypothetical protein